jgi:hypothetical protein
MNKWPHMKFNNSIITQPEAKTSESKKKAMVKTKRPKYAVGEQYGNLQEACRTVVHHLKQKGIPLPEARIKTFGDGLPDSKTGAMVINALAPISFLLSRFSGLSSWFQRKTFHHTRDKIYQRLIVAILKGYYVPPLRVAAMANEGVVTDPKLASDWTLIDGLQRTTCFIIAVLMAALRDELVEMGCIDEKTWNGTFREHAEACDVNELLRRQQQMEVFYEIDLPGVLHFMLLLNGAQRQMSAKIQLELMNAPLIQLLQKEGIRLEKEQEKAADHKLDRASFKGSNLIVAVQGYMQRNPQVMTSEEKESFLIDEREYLGPVEGMEDVIEVLKVVTGPLHNAVLNRLESTILSEGEVFSTALMAAAGKYTEMTSFDQLRAALKRLVSDVENGKDPLALETYWRVYSGLKSGKGRKIRSIICAAFLEYFRGNSRELEWEENALVYE